MAEKNLRRSWVMVNRMSLLVLWAAVLAEFPGFEHGVTRDVVAYVAL
jgi:hypothetical protein